MSQGSGLLCCREDYHYSNARNCGDIAGVACDWSAMLQMTFYTVGAVEEVAIRNAVLQKTLTFKLNP